MKTRIAILTVIAAAACGTDMDNDAVTDQLRADGLAAVMEYANREMFAEFPPTAVAHAAGLGGDDATALAEYADRHDLLFTQTEVCVTGEESICQRVGPGSHRWVRVDRVDATEDGSLRVTLVWYDQIQGVEYDTGLLLGSAEFLAARSPQGWTVERETRSLEQTDAEPMGDSDVSFAVSPLWTPQQTCGKVGGITESTNCTRVTQGEYQSIRNLMDNPYDPWGDYFNWRRCQDIIDMVDAAWAADKWFWYDRAAGDTRTSIITGWHYDDQLGLRRGRNPHQVMTTSMHESYHHAGYSHSAAFTRKVGWWSQNCIRI